MSQNTREGYVFHRHQTSACIARKTTEFELYNNRQTRMTAVVAIRAPFQPGSRFMLAVTPPIVRSAQRYGVWQLNSIDCG